MEYNGRILKSLSDIQARARTANPEGALTPSAAKVLRNTYLLLGITLLPTILGAFVGVQYPILFQAGLLAYFITFFLIIFGVQYMIVRHANSMAGVNWLLFFTFCLGYFLGPLLSVALSFSNGVELIAMAMGGTAAMFFVLAGFASTTKRNLATPGIFKVLFVGMIVAFIASIIGVFVQVPALSLAVSVIFMLIAGGFLTYTVNAIVRGGETNYILATLTIFIMLYNIFSSLLHILLAFAGNRE